VKGRSIHILLVEDNAADVRLMKEALHGFQHPHSLSVVQDGQEAIAFLEQTGKYAGAHRPDLVLLDINLPRRTGHEVLCHLKARPALRRVVVIMLSSSDAEKDVRQAYDCHANCYIQKPRDLDGFFRVAAAIEAFWLDIVRLPVAV
jgi:two-component system, chemotaxis family, response regulator Rcp1